jgi:hypothetical protein
MTPWREPVLAELPWPAAQSKQEKKMRLQVLQKRTPQRSTTAQSSSSARNQVAKLCLLNIQQIARSFYIRFAKITLRNAITLPQPPDRGYNVFRYQ